jgi:hypothetical protein
MLRTRQHLSFVPPQLLEWFVAKPSLMLLSFLVPHHVRSRVNDLLSEFQFLKLSHWWFADSSGDESVVKPHPKLAKRIILKVLAN